ncbi:hypothetical protein DBB29_09010 [Pandoraea cepalis]|uniref:Uncharacterized protein n=1 Tax=Pandoraea cepalis TaxID=2508294 RepID=A0AAW7MLH6_9BURK|nr:hypothetical protein [Pandoraea cepalis]MDN4573714.1 hypothetical protein [Pandoraea cepalis]MDN4578256.1 hypothetical protein [Pandoraea cepalis]
MRWIERYQKLIGFAVAFVAGVLVASFWMYREAKSFWDVLTAVGTLGAAGSAVGIATIQWKRESSNAATRGVIAAALMRDRTRLMMQRANALWLLLEHYSSKPLEDAGMLRALTDRLDDIKLVAPWNTDELISLVGVPGNLAYKTAKAVGAFNDAVSSADTTWHLFVAAPAITRSRFAAEYGPLFRQAGAQLKIALEAMDTVVSELEN